MCCYYLDYYSSLDALLVKPAEAIKILKACKLRLEQLHEIKRKRDFVDFTS